MQSAYNNGLLQQVQSYVTSEAGRHAAESHFQSEAVFTLKQARYSQPQLSDCYWLDERLETTTETKTSTSLEEVVVGDEEADFEKLQEKTNLDGVIICATYCL